MKINIKIFVIFLLCIFGGLMDGLCYFYVHQTFCLIQTGNIVKTIVSYSQGNIQDGIFYMVVFLGFLLSIFLYYLLKLFLQERNYNTKIFGLLIIVILLIPPYFKHFLLNESLIFDYICSLSFAFIGGIVLTEFNYTGHIEYNVTMMTGNSRHMMESFAKGVKEKDKKHVLIGLNYLYMIIAFIIGLVVSSLFYNFVEKELSYYCLLIIGHLLLFISILIEYIARGKFSLKLG